MANLSFEAQVDAWVRETKQRMEAVFRASVIDVCDAMQANVPYDTGFLRSSFEVRLNAPLPPATKEKGAMINLPSYEMTIAGAQLGDYVTAGYSAAYGPYLEYGTSKIPPRAWVRSAAAQWKTIVNRNITKAKAAVAANGAGKS